MRRLILCSLLASVLLPAGVASAGGWATAGVGPPPDGMSGGDTWNAQITILQHGQTPLVGVKPTLTIRSDSGKAVTFPAKPTGKAESGRRWRGCTSHTTGAGTALAWPTSSSSTNR